ncbi:MULTISPECIES: hypothetical protein [Streptomyces]|uniref:hypothetical protein n=1 Tax=Streptomyces TaxID=1883 RepID=UPI001E5BA350|nr:MULTISPECIES: hypothetical protein [Streptomyces]UFQ16431.1 hypothetical protein J2N69_16260 [Streptomyces huasconensis]WCL86033.1 hypothetical protein PPN52_16270 [Streptomyces sp. JCM 35825]
MSTDMDTAAEEWGRMFAAEAGVEYVPLVRRRDADVEGRSSIQFLFDRRQRFEASAVAMRLLDKDLGVAHLFVHVENWIAVEIELGNKVFEGGAE